MSRIPEILRKHQSDLLRDWVKEQLAAPGRRSDLIKDDELRQQCNEFLTLLQSAAQDGEFSNIQSQAYGPLRELLTEVSRSRARQGFTPSETAMFVFSFKQPLFTRLRKEYGNDAQALVDETWAATELIDRLGIFTAETYVKGREDVIRRQQQEMMELSTPVVKMWEGIVALPLIGTLDSARTQVVMEALLQKILETGSQVAIIDITGVPTVDTLVAQHLIKTITAARLMGAECIISGIRPQIAQTIVHLGVGLADVITKANLSDAFALALRRVGLTVRPVSVNKPPASPASVEA
jgi:rsbT co-antagonist protein RsbR